MPDGNVEQRMEMLASFHPDANIPDQPYCGVAALFNGDIRLVDPELAPRESWQVLSPYEIQLEPIAD